jgi:hypothetical protein
VAGKKLTPKSTKPVDPRTAAFARKFMFWVNLLAMSLWSFVFTAEYAEWVWERIKAGKRGTQTVELAVTNGVTPTTIKGTILGTTTQYVFVYDRAANITRIIAAENIADIVVEGRKPKPRKGR